jgi:hypothetical protein
MPPRAPAQEPCPEDMQEEQTLAPLRDVLWVPPPPEPEDGEPPATEEEEKKEAELPARFTKLGPTDEPPNKKEDAPETKNFELAIDEIQEKQTAALQELVAKYFEELGDRYTFSIIRFP